MTNDHLLKRLAEALADGRDSLQKMNSLQRLLVDCVVYKQGVIKTRDQEDLLNAYTRAAYEQIGMMAFKSYAVDEESIRWLLINICNFG